MFKTLLPTIAASATLLFAGLAFADHDDRDDHKEYHKAEKSDHKGYHRDYDQRHRAAHQDGYFRNKGQHKEWHAREKAEHKDFDRGLKRDHQDYHNGYSRAGRYGSGSGHVHDRYCGCSDSPYRNGQYRSGRYDDRSYRSGRYDDYGYGRGRYDDYDDRYRNGRYDDYDYDARYRGRRGDCEDDYYYRDNRRNGSRSIPSILLPRLGQNGAVTDLLGGLLRNKLNK